MRGSVLLGVAGVLFVASGGMVAGHFLADDAEPTISAAEAAPAPVVQPKPAAADVPAALQGELAMVLGTVGGALAGTLAPLSGNVTDTFVPLPTSLSMSSWP